MTEEYTVNLFLKKFSQSTHLPIHSQLSMSLWVLDLQPPWKASSDVKEVTARPLLMNGQSLTSEDEVLLGFVL